jgi:hypothetical protein
MGSLQQQADAGLFNVVHKTLAGQHAAETVERRQGPRQPFPTVQWIAPDYERDVPPPEALVEVCCRDLTQAGFSFFWPTPPRFQRFIVAFGQPPARLYVKAQVVYWRRVLVDPSGTIVWQGKPGQKIAVKQPDLPDAQLQVLVGCRLTGKLPAS